MQPVQTMSIWRMMNTRRSSCSVKQHCSQMPDLTDADIPEGLYCYHLRHSDDGGKFCSVEPSVGVNHGGSVILKEPLDFGKSEYIPLDEETSPNFSGERENFSDFLSDTSPQEAEEMKLC